MPRKRIFLVPSEGPMDTKYEPTQEPSAVESKAPQFAPELRELASEITEIVRELERQLVELAQRHAIETWIYMDRLGQSVGVARHKGVYRLWVNGTPPTPLADASLTTKESFLMSSAALNFVSSVVMKAKHRKMHLGDARARGKGLLEHLTSELAEPKDAP